METFTSCEWERPDRRALETISMKRSRAAGLSRHVSAKPSATRWKPCSGAHAQLTHDDGGELIRRQPASLHLLT